MRRRSFVALLGGASLAAAGLPSAFAREGVDVGAALAAEQAGPRRAGRAGRGRAVQPAARPGRGQARARAGQPSAGACGCARSPQRLIPYTYEWNARAARLALGGQPDRQQADQRLLHAGRQDRLLLRHPRPAQAHRRRGRDDHGPRDGPCAARACARADGQEHWRPRGAIEIGAALLGLGSGGRLARRHGRPAADAALRPRGRDPRPTWSASSSPHAPATTRAPA